jgi:hypothetical protein
MVPHNGNSNSAVKHLVEIGYDTVLARSDINPDDIESQRCGLLLPQLYGSRASNGVVNDCCEKKVETERSWCNHIFVLGTADSSTYPGINTDRLWSTTPLKTDTNLDDINGWV